MQQLISIASLFHSFNHLLEKPGIVVFECVQKPVNVQVFNKVKKQGFLTCMHLYSSLANCLAGNVQS